MKKRSFFSIKIEEKRKIDIWEENSKNIDWQKIYDKPVNIVGNEWNNQLKFFALENINFSQIKEIIEVLSTQ
ncbi:hypothetical protein [Spiroplasma endosymbiont of Cantharis nigra]|uniref:hypothetical protein n=1 Tax=Spiroplasma endosymbiont of Cantharis nigra TaxID=3066278 RepID=UPI0030CDAAD8